MEELDLSGILTDLSASVLVQTRKEAFALIFFFLPRNFKGKIN